MKKVIGLMKDDLRGKLLEKKTNDKLKHIAKLMK